MILPPLLLPLLLACRADPPAPTRSLELKGGATNILLVVFDTTRADHLSSYGYPIPTTPNLDALAQDGIRFSQYLSNSSWTRPGFASLLTGRYPREVGIYEEEFDTLPDDVVLLPERLKEKGYLTLGVSSNPNVDTIFGFNQGYDTYLDATVVWKHARKGKEQTLLGQGSGYLDDATLVNQRTLELLDQNKDALKEKPYFLHMIYIDPHAPLHPPDEDKAAVAGSEYVDYDGELHQADAEFGRLLQEMRSRGLLDNTLIIVTSDHGEGLKSHPGIPLSNTHGPTLYESVLQVPLIISHPLLPKGKVIDDLASAIDIVPTLLDLLGWPLSEAMPGLSLAPLLRGDGTLNRPPYVFAETDFRYNQKVAIRTPTHKYIWNEDCARYLADGTHEGKELDNLYLKHFAVVPPEELYKNGKKEIPARQDRSDTEPGTATVLAAMLQEWQATTTARPPLRRDPEDVLMKGDGTVLKMGGDAVELDENTRKSLEALGYLGN